jgi:hypothetical protein
VFITEKEVRKLLAVAPENLIKYSFVLYCLQNKDDDCVVLEKRIQRTREEFDSIILVRRQVEGELRSVCLAISREDGERLAIDNMVVDGELLKVSYKRTLPTGEQKCEDCQYYLD